MHLKYICNSSTLAQSNILHYIFSVTLSSTKLVGPNSADFKYSSLVYQKYNCRLFVYLAHKYVNVFVVYLVSME